MDRDIFEKSIYEKNMEAFHARYDYVATQIEEKDFELLGGLSVELEGEDLIKVEKDGQSVILGTQYCETERAQKWIGDIKSLPEYSTVLIVGFGNAFYLQELLRETTENFNILIYEPCMEVFLKVLEEIDITEVFHNRPVALLIKGLNEEELIPVMCQWLTNETLPYFRTKILPGYDQLFVDEIKEFLGIVKRTLVKMKTEQNTVAFFGNFYARNVIGNAKYVLKSHTVNQLLGLIPNDRPAIVIAAGPSLKKNIHDLKDAKGRAFLIAVDTALKPLLAAGITPDIFVTVDGNKPVELFDREEIWNIPMVLSADVNYEVVRKHIGKKIFNYNGEGFIQKFYLDNNVPCSGLPSGGSVSNSAFSLAEQLGFQTIILVGQDLAYTGNRSHIEGSFSEDEIQRKHGNATAIVEDMDGNMVPTQPNMLMFLQWFEDRMKERPELRVIDATEGGAKKKGAIIMTLKEAIEEECPRDKVDYKAVIDELPYVFDEEMDRRNRKYLFDTLDIMREGIKKANQGLKLYNQLERLFKRNQVDAAKVKKIGRKLDKLAKYFEQEHVMTVVMRSMAAVSLAISQGMYNYEEDIHDEGIMIARQGIVMMTCVKISLQNIIPMLEDMLEELRAETEEAQKIRT
ncbi:MAG: motility associated factor glycosyltransferase family protein [Lachnospiraceae bacterium]|nr:motility associated factor glycosyltransferase family protein [Lachnospiraceae bacterium]